MTRWSRSFGLIVTALLVLTGCGSSDDTPQQGDNPIATNAKNSADMGDQARVRAQSAPQRSGTKLKAAGE